MNNFGHVIKLERIRRNMKQITLAQGICTPSYLSKIENNSIVPSQEVVNLLLNRLELAINQNKSLDDESYLKHIREIYFNAVMNKDREHTAKALKEINNERYLFKDSSNFYTYQLMVLRLTLIVPEVRNDTSDLIIALSELSSNFDEYQTFLFNSCLGSYYYFKHDFTFSLSAFEKAYKGHQQLSIEEWETADFYYMLSIIYIQHQRVVTCTEFIQKALTYFKDNFFYIRAIECYLVLSVAQKTSYKLDEALETLQLAKRIAIQLNLEDHFSVIYHNLGAIMSWQGKSEEAIEHYIESMTLSDRTETKLISVLSIAQEYSKQSNSVKVIEWSKKGLELLNEQHENGLIRFQHHFNIYLSKYTNYLNFEKVVLNAIQYFKDAKDYLYTYKYYIFLAEYFNEINKYKNAAKYYAASNEYLFLKNNYTSWEDL
ncbi:helix-turn-helix transcriptional regulator [Paenisporosarcina quisquiliarum]|uniref:Helix-turn-helix transcriptional regulator n=1 Tax=Paenisporosarcina quisquiliarum TaxID=365346 RepID=A0A9X3LI55_9BACL|nr:helix-turn-helix transcriptional regulator [Paenisporosarcina quisquiliarum]MCZ8538475.1 helix-turn-helix transcriptional regulator [Paenisporosarcina quisquiliarum]